MCLAVVGARLPRAANATDHNPPTAEVFLVLPADSWEVERRSDGAVLVRVRSRKTSGRALPDAVFAFRPGDPQYAYWEEQLRHREILNLGAAATTPAAPTSMPIPLS